MEKVDWIEHMQVLELKDSDTVVVKVKDRVNDELRHHIEDTMGELFKEKNIKTLVLDDSMDIGVIRIVKDGGTNMDNERWTAAIDNARFMLEEYKKIPAGMFGATMIAQAITRYDNGERTDELLEELEGIE